MGLLTGIWIARAVCAAIALLMVATAASCRHTHPFPEPGEPALEPPRPDLPDAQGSSAEISGSVYLVGLTISDGHAASAEDPGGFPGDPGGGSGPGIGVPGIRVKILDPGDDILSETVTVADGSYALSLDTSVLGKLAVELEVAEDVDGDGSGGDLITQALPINVEAGKLATVDVTFALGLSSETGGGLFPDGEPVLFVEVFQADLNGARTDLLAQGPNGELVIDKDGDQFLEPGDDAVYTDLDRNGVPDSYEEALDPSDAPATQSPYEGVVVAVNVSALTLELQLIDGSLRHFEVSPFAAIYPLLGGEDYLDEVPFDQSLVGQQVFVFAVEGVDGPIADMIGVLGPADPFGGSAPPGAR